MGGAYPSEAGVTGSRCRLQYSGADSPWRAIFDQMGLDVAANQIAKSGSKPARPPARTAAQIEADLVATRERLTASVETLVDTVHPSRIKQRQIAGIKRFVATELDDAKALVFNARGDLRTERLAVVGAAAVGALTFLTVVGRLARRGRGS